MRCIKPSLPIIFIIILQKETTTIYSNIARNFSKKKKRKHCKKENIEITIHAKKKGFIILFLVILLPFFGVWVCVVLLKLART